MKSYAAKKGWGEKRTLNLQWAAVSNQRPEEGGRLDSTVATTEGRHETKFTNLQGVMVEVGGEEGKTGSFNDLGPRGGEKRANDGIFFSSATE